MDPLETLAQSLFDKLGSRECVSLACGYYPASKAWHMKETYGFPLIELAIWCRKKNLEMDWDGIRLEAYRRGADIDGEVEEAKREMRLVERD
jgi:hypothetical protein